MTSLLPLRPGNFHRTRSFFFPHAASMQGMGFAVCGVYLIDAHFMVDPSKFVSGALLCLSTMISLVRREAPCVIVFVHNALPPLLAH